MKKPAEKLTTSKQFAQQLQRVQQRFDALAQREKVIVSLVCVVGVAMIVQLLALDPLLRKRDATQKALTKSSGDINALQIEIQTLNQAIVAGPKRQKEKQLDALKLEITSLDEQIAKTTTAMIPPRLMTDVLRDVLQLRSDIRLVSLENLAPEPLLTDEDLGIAQKKSTEKTAAQKPQKPVDVFLGVPAGKAATPTLAEVDVGLYRHGVTLVFEGDYMATLQFLQALEQKPWRFFWQQLQYSVEKYPTARVTLTLYTLSPERAWLGV